MPVLIRSSAANDTSSGGTLAIPAPAGVVAGDLLIAFQHSNNNTQLSSFVPPSGWTERYSNITPGSTKIYTKTATGSEPTSYSFTGGSSDWSCSIVAVQAGSYDTATPFAVAPVFSTDTASSTSHVAPSVTGVNGGVLLCMFGACGSANLARTYTPPSGMTELTDVNSGGWTAQSITSLALSSTAATGAKTATLSAATPYKAASLVLAPAPATPPAGRALPSTGLVARYEALSETGKTDGAALAQLTDSVAGLHAVQATAANQPLYRTGAVNGQPAYEFDGVNDGAIAPVVFTSQTALTMTLVVSSGAAEATSRVFVAGLLSSGNGTTGVFAITEGEVSGEWGAYVQGASQGFHSVSTSGVNTTAWSVLTLAVSGGTYSLYRNGTFVASGTGGTYTSAQFLLGSMFSTYFSGRIALAAVWTAGLSAADRAQVHSYAQDVYGITVADYVPSASPATVTGVTATGSASAAAGVAVSDASVTGETATGSGSAIAGSAAGGASPDATVTGATATGSAAAGAGVATGSASADAMVVGVTATGAGDAFAGSATGAVGASDGLVVGVTAVGSANADAGLVSAGGVAVEPPRVGVEWTLLTRGPDGRLTGPVPILALSAVTRHLGVGTGTATVPYSRHAYALLTEGAGVEVYRNGHRVSSGFLTSVKEAWPADTIVVQWVSEEVLFQDHIVIPDPTRPGYDQSTEGYYERNGVPSTLMLTLIGEQMGPAAHAMWRVPGLTVGPDPVVGGDPTLMPYYGRYQDLMSTLKTMVTYSNVELGVRLGPDLVAQVVAPVESAGTARFSSDLGNLTSYEFTRSAPTVTDVIVAELGLEIPEPVGGWEPGFEPNQNERDIYKWMTAAQEVFPSEDPIATAWGRRIWEFSDQSGKIDWKYFADVRADMRRQAAQQAQADGAAKVELTCTLRDSPRLKYGEDWDVGHRVTVYVGRPGEPKVEVVDVVREIAFEYGKGGEKITPAIGSADATALPFLPSRQILNRIRSRLAGLERKS